jgi:hypothetical protein
LLRDREDADIVFKDEEEEEEEEERGTSVGTEDPLQLPGGSLPQTPRYGTVFVKNCWFILRSSAADS